MKKKRIENATTLAGEMPTKQNQNRASFLECRGCLEQLASIHLDISAHGPTNHPVLVPANQDLHLHNRLETRLERVIFDIIEPKIKE